jgi:hypothetical protein
MVNYYKYRKNYSGGTTQIALSASPGYPDDPFYDEIAMDSGHTLPNGVNDDSTMDDRFNLVIWSDTIDPGADPSMEIVVAERTTHPLVYQIVERGAEDTSISAHPIGSNVGLHYTALVSEEDLAPIQAILDAVEGSIIYTWSNVFGEKRIGILAPGTSGMTLHTAGAGQPPYWDWVYGLASRTFLLYIFMEGSGAIETMDKTLLHTVDEAEIYTQYSTSSHDIEIDHASSFVDGSIEMSPTLIKPDLGNDSFSEPWHNQLIDETNLYTEYDTTVV